MFDISILEVDPAKSLEGVWVDYLMGSRLKVARSTNKDAENFRMQKAIEHADLFNAGGPESDKLMFEVENEALAYFVLKDWSGIILNKNSKKETPYTPENGLKLLSDPRYTDFREAVLNIARNRQHYRDAAEAEAVSVVKETAAS